MDFCIWLKKRWIALAQLLIVGTILLIIICHPKFTEKIMTAGKKTVTAADDLGSISAGTWILTAAIFTVIITCITNIKMAIEKKDPTFLRAVVAFLAVVLLVLQISTGLLVWVGRMDINTGVLCIGLFSVFLICIIDVCVAILYDGKNITGNFWRIFWCLDLPILVGVIVLMMYEPNIRTVPLFSKGFSTGGIALQIIIGNVAYAVMGIGGFFTS